jgi:KipI family sensor histidine kinase inhibitor
VSTPRIVPAGDAALVVEFEEKIDPAISARCASLADALNVEQIAGVRDVVPTYRSVAVYFDPLRTDRQRLVLTLERLAAQPVQPDTRRRASIQIPVCYGGEYGPDLPKVGAFAGLAEAEVIALHAGATYQVMMLGFVPGFAYMGVVDARIAAPRLETPRPRVPRGSVGIAQAQTGIYPSDTPGGWLLIGRTPVRPFDLDRPDPFLFHAGDEVRFVPIARKEFDERDRAR